MLVEVRNESRPGASPVAGVKALALEQGQVLQRGQGKEQNRGRSRNRNRDRFFSRGRGRGRGRSRRRYAGPAP